MLTCPQIDLPSFFGQRSNAHTILRQRPLPSWQVVKEKRATFAATPVQLARRPKVTTHWRNLVLAGDWTDTGLPATIESAVRSGFAAADTLFNCVFKVFEEREAAISRVAGSQDGSSFVKLVRIWQTRMTDFCNRQGDSGPCVHSFWLLHFSVRHTSTGVRGGPIGALQKGD